MLKNIYITRSNFFVYFGERNFEKWFCIYQYIRGLWGGVRRSALLDLERALVACEMSISCKSIDGIFDVKRLSVRIVLYEKSLQLAGGVGMTCIRVRMCSYLL